MSTGDTIKVGDTVKINTAWADAEWPNVEGVVRSLHHGGNVAEIDTLKGPRRLHVQYLQRVKK